MRTPRIFSTIFLSTIKETYFSYIDYPTLTWPSRKVKTLMNKYIFKHITFLLHIIPTRYTIHRVYFYLTLLYMFRVLSLPILRSTKQLHLQHPVNITL